MKSVVMTRPMKPYQLDHTYAFPDVMADKLVADGDAKMAPAADGDGVTLAPDAPPAKPRNRYLTRGHRP